MVKYILLSCTQFKSILKNLVRSHYFLVIRQFLQEVTIIRKTRTYKLYKSFFNAPESRISIETFLVLYCSNSLKLKMKRKYFLGKLHRDYSDIFFTKLYKTTISSHRKIVKIDSYLTMYTSIDYCHFSLLQNDLIG
jgi:hypothetical protein